MAIEPGKLGIMDKSLHVAIIEAMSTAGVDVGDGDKVIEAYLLTLIYFFKGLKDEGRNAEQINYYVDWLAMNIKNNVNAPESPKRV